MIPISFLPPKTWLITAAFSLSHPILKGFGDTIKILFSPLTSHVLLTTREEILSYLITHKNGLYNSEFNITLLLIALDRVLYFLIELRVISHSALVGKREFGSVRMLLLPSRKIRCREAPFCWSLGPKAQSFLFFPPQIFFL